jgi:YD repeat-containing protein
MHIMNRLFGKCAVVVLLLGVLLPFQGNCTTISYQYDRLNRLTLVHYGDGTRIAYAYDPAGNRLSRSISRIGDINKDKIVNLTDAILVLQVVSGLKPDSIRPDYAGSGADVGGNQKIGMEEAIYILQTVAVNHQIYQGIDALTCGIDHRPSLLCEVYHTFAVKYFTDISKIHLDNTILPCIAYY